MTRIESLRLFTRVLNLHNCSYTGCSQRRIHTQSGWNRRTRRWSRTWLLCSLGSWAQLAAQQREKPPTCHLSRDETLLMSLRGSTTLLSALLVSCTRHSKNLKRVSSVRQELTGQFVLLIQFQQDRCLIAVKQIILTQSRWSSDEALCGVWEWAEVSRRSVVEP